MDEAQVRPNLELHLHEARSTKYQYQDIYTLASRAVQRLASTVHPKARIIILGMHQVRRLRATVTDQFLHMFLPCHHARRLHTPREHRALICPQEVSAMSHITANERVYNILYLPRRIVLQVLANKWAMTSSPGRQSDLYPSMAPTMITNLAFLHGSGICINALLLLVCSEIRAIKRLTLIEHIESKGPC